MLFEHENIVIGSDLRALLFALVNEYPVFYTKPRVPHLFEFLDLKLNLDFIHIDNQPQSLRSFKNDFKFGQKKILLWEKLNFLLSMRGFVPISDMCDIMRYDGETLSCSSEYKKLCEVRFDKCFYFGDNGVHKLITKRKKQNVRYKVFDRIGFHTGGKHDIEYIKTNDDFVREVWFYSSDRICGNTGVKDACALSILSYDELNSNPYTQTMTSFKLCSILKNNGIMGKPSGYRRDGTPRYRNHKTSYIDRHVYPIDAPQWEETSKIKKINLSLSELVDIASQSDLSSYSYLNGTKL